MVRDVDRTLPRQPGSHGGTGPLFRATEAILYPRHTYPNSIAWIGSLLLGLSACSGEEGSDDGNLPSFVAGGSGGNGAAAAPSAGSGGQAGVVPPTSTGGSTNESGIPVTGGITTGGTGGSGTAAAGAAGDAGVPALPGAPDAGVVTPPDTVVDGPVGPGPSSLPPRGSHLPICSSGKARAPPTKK